MKQIVFGDLFAGIGGFRLGLQAAGMRCAFSVEKNPIAARAYEQIHGESPLGDILEAKNLGACDVIAAGFPCPPFSGPGVSARKSLGRAHGLEAEDGKLFREALRIADECGAQAILFENVAKLVTHNGGATWRTMKAEIEFHGFEVMEKVISTETVVPQARRRVYIVGIRGGLNGFEFPEFIGPAKQLREALETGRDFTRYKISDKLLAGFERRASANKARGAGFGHKIANLFEPAPTLVSRYYKDGKEILIKYKDGLRRLTEREAARIMGFPESVNLTGANAYKCLGNAVVPAMIERIGVNLKNALN